jgi:GNAT superfamily N-acetyltransferase
MGVTIVNREYGMQKSSYTVRTMTRPEVDIAAEWAAAEGWNPGLYDADCFYAADPNGFLIGLLGDEPVATISAVRYDASFGFIGFYLVKPEHRSNGYGIQIWNAALSYLQACNIGLDGVIAQQDNYRKSGFTLAYRNIRYEGVGGGRHQAESELVRLSAVPFEEVCAYDGTLFPAGRRGFLRRWIDQPESTALGILSDGKLAGYGVLRLCRSGYKIGPLFADRPEYAEALFVALKAHAAEGTPLYLDVPEVNPAAVDLAKRYNMNAVFETARMYTGKSPDLPMNRLFGVTTFELG